jgi:ribosomal protein L17
VAPQAVPPAEAQANPPGEEQLGGELQNEFGVAPVEGMPPAGGGGGGRGGLPPGRGPLAEPGTFKVTIELAGKTDSKTVTVEQDPRIQVAASDRDTRRRTIDTLVTLARDADAARRRAAAIRNSLTSLTDGWKQPNASQVPDAVRKAVDDLLDRAKTVANRFEAPGGGRGGGAGSPPPYTPPPVTQKIARLLGALDNYTGAPTPRQLTEAQDCSAQLQKDVAELNKLVADVPRLNKMMSDAGVSYFNIPAIP